MKISKQDLIQAIDDAIKAEQAAIAEYADARAQFDDRRTQDWVDNVLPSGARSLP